MKETHHDLAAGRDLPLRPLVRIAAEAADSQLRSVFLQHRLIEAFGTAGPVSPTMARVVVHAVVDRLLALPAGLEPLMLLQQDAAVLRASTRTAVLSVVLARAAGWPDDRLADFGAVALLHDLGAILDPARPAAAAFEWLIDRGTDDFWLRSALVARHWRSDHGSTLAAAGSGSTGAAVVVRLAAAIETMLARGRSKDDIRPELARVAAAGAFPSDLVDLAMMIVVGQSARVIAK